MNENISSNLTIGKKSSVFELPPRHVALIVFEVGTVLLIDITAFLGNILVCCAIYRNVRLRTVINFPIVSLAISDLLFAIVCLPFSLGVLMHGKWIYGNVLCAVQAYFINSLASISILTMTFTAVNRYFKIVRSAASYRRHFTKRKTRAFTVMIWFGTFCVSAVPPASCLADIVFSARKACCIYFYKAGATPLTAMLMIISFVVVIPWIITVVCYVQVFVSIRQHKVNTAANSQLGPSVEDIKITRTLLAVVGGFSFCWLPTVFISCRHIFGIGRSSRSLHMTYSIMGALSCAINPIIYGVMNKAFRKEFLQVLPSCISSTTAETSGHSV